MSFHAWASVRIVCVIAVCCVLPAIGKAQGVPESTEIAALARELSPIAPFSLADQSSYVNSEGLALEEGMIPVADIVHLEAWPPLEESSDAIVKAAVKIPAPTDPKPPEKPKYPSIILSGIAQIDGIWFSQDEANRAVVGEARDDAGFRRARLGVRGDLAENVAYQMEYDFAFPGRPSFMDVYVDVADLSPVGRFRVGQWRQPFNMDALTSVRDLMFMERSLPFALVPFRQTGLGIYDTAFEEQATWAISGYRFPTDAFGNVAGDRGYGMSTRETVLLYFDDSGNTIHLGAGYTWNAPSTGTLRIRSTPEVGFTQLDISNVADFPIPFFVNTGFLPTDDYQVGDLEFAFGIGSLVFQTEYLYAVLNEPGGPSLNFPAFYAQVGYVLTGERRAYNRKMGSYGRVLPRCPYGKGGNGAWEVATRYSMIDLNDADVQGGRLQDYTFGLNWYLNGYTRFEFNYIHPFLDRPVGNYTHADIFAVRAQFDF